MKLSIHHTPGSFSDRWIEYCKKQNIQYTLVDCYDSNIITQLSDSDGLLWHWDLNDYKSTLLARQLILSLEKKGIRVFPDINTCWHYDDKLGQKYLLEAINAPLVKSYVFYSRNDALKWMNETTFPKVFKLRGGAGSINVRLVRTKQKAKQLINKAFNRGFPHIDPISRIKDQFWTFRRDKNILGIKNIISGLVRLIFPTQIERFSHREKGYIYFQDFIPENDFDSRLIVIGDRCFGMRRYCRKNDFRASGSGLLAYEKELFDTEAVKIAFEVSDALNTQSVAFDFIKHNGKNMIIEISYCYKMGKIYDDCHGYWDRKLNWHNTSVNLQYFIIEDFIKKMRVE